MVGRLVLREARIITKANVCRWPVLNRQPAPVLCHQALVGISDVLFPQEQRNTATKWYLLPITRYVTGINQNDLKCDRVIAPAVNGRVVTTTAKMTVKDPN